MSSAMMLERTGVGVPGVGIPGFGTPGVGAPTTVPVGANWLVVPRGTFKFEKMQGGLKITCVCEDKVAASMCHNLFQMLAGGLCSCYCVLNGVPVCCYYFSYCQCKTEPTDTGFYMTCTSGDPQYAQMIQSCCESLQACFTAGCTCFVCMNNTPVCCGCSESMGSTKSKK